MNLSRRLCTLSVAVIVFALLAMASAHAHLSASTPAADSSVPATGEPFVISMQFTQGLDLAFSTFKLVRVEHDLDADSETFAEDLRQVASQMVPEAMASPDVVDGQVVFIIEPPSGMVEEFTLTTLEPLQPGSYVLMWSALSADSHITEGFLVFSVVP